MFERIRTGQVSKKWGYIITIGASLCILMIVLTGFFFNSPEKTSAKTEVKQYSVESSLKYAPNVRYHIKIIFQLKIISQIAAFREYCLSCTGCLRCYSPPKWQEGFMVFQKCHNV